MGPESQSTTNTLPSASYFRQNKHELCIIKSPLSATFNGFCTLLPFHLGLHCFFLYLPETIPNCSSVSSSAFEFIFVKARFSLCDKSNIILVVFVVGSICSWNRNRTSAFSIVFFKFCPRFPKWRFGFVFFFFFKARSSCWWLWRSW